MADKDTTISGSPEFPSTVWSRIQNCAEPGKAAEHLASCYWKPVYIYVRRKWGRSNEDAKDLTQGFFADMLERNFLSKAIPERGSFRHFLRASLENYLANASRDAKAVKRGGRAKVVPLEALMDGDVGDQGEGDPAACFDRAWLAAVLERSLARLKEEYAAEGRVVYHDLLKRYDVDRDPANKVTYEDLAAEFKLPLTDVRNWLAHARSRWQKLIREEMRETTGSQEDFEREVRELLRP